MTTQGVSKEVCRVCRMIEPHFFSVLVMQSILTIIQFRAMLIMTFSGDPLGRVPTVKLMTSDVFSASERRKLQADTDKLLGSESS